MSANLFDLVARTADAHPDQVALHSGPTSLSYRDLDEHSAQLAGLLRDAGVAPGDRVALLLPNVPAFAETYLAALRVGAIVVPMNPLLKGREVAFFLADAGVSVLFAWADCGPVVDDALDLLPDDAPGPRVHLVGPDGTGTLRDGVAPSPAVTARDTHDTAVLLYTSGTTGQPKGAELTHGNLTSNVAEGVKLFALLPEDVVVGALPLFHAFGQVCCLNSVLAVGASMVLVARFEPGAVLAAIERHGATIFMGVPTMYSALVHHPDIHAVDTSSLRMCCSGGSALPLEVLAASEQALGCVLLEGYGLSETSPLATFNRRGRQRPGSIGVPIDGVEVRILDEDGAEVPPGEVGEVTVRGPNVMKGYWNRPDATAQVLDDAGWFRTGDLGRRDDDGFLYVVDRKKEVVIRGGFNVYPREVEEVLHEHPAVRECAVIGVPDEHLGEEVAAAVALREDATVTPDELRAYVKDRVAAYKYPRHLWFVDALPKGATNKILKRDITVPAGLA